MNKILVSPSHLEEVAALFVNQRQELEQMCRKLDEQIHFVQSNWSGATRERFFEEYRTARETIKVTFEQISAIGQQLHFIAREFRRVDGEHEVIQYPDGAIFRGVYDSATETYNDIKATGQSFLEHPFRTTFEFAYGLTIGEIN